MDEGAVVGDDEEVVGGTDDVVTGGWVVVVVVEEVLVPALQAVSNKAMTRTSARRTRLSFRT